MAELMMAHLTNGRGEIYAEQYPDAFKNNHEVLSLANGCALISEGLVIYFYPYILSIGADGQYDAVIPYSELEGILNSI